MPPVSYSVVCKLCGYRREGALDIIIDSIDKHLSQRHKITWRDSEGDIFRDFMKKVKKLIPQLSGEKGVVSACVENTAITYDKVEKVWSIITPLFEISSAGHRITEEERKEAEAIAERLKREREELEKERERERKRIKYRKKYHRYHKCYGDYFKTKAFHTLQNLSTPSSIERADFMQLWVKYTTLKTGGNVDTPEFHEVTEELKRHRLWGQPMTKKDLEKLKKDLSLLRLDHSRLCKKCPLRTFCKLSRSAHYLSREILAEEGCVLLQKLFAPSP